MGLEIVTAGGRGVHLASSGRDQAFCQRPILQRTGREGSAKTPHLCPSCARALAAAARGRPS
jgi:hypothetical protein